MKIDIWKRPWLAVLLLFLCFLLVGYFERQDQELFERMAPFTEACDELDGRRLQRRTRPLDG